MFTTRTEAINFLASQGKPLPFVKVAIHQAFNYEKDGDTRDLMFDNELLDENNDCVPRDFDEDEIMSQYDTFEEMLKVTDKGIEVDGDLLYDLNGDPLV